ncbi:hypothetical protein VULLAG_LOCUS3793 [Vulpes lagopus]
MNRPRSFLMLATSANSIDGKCKAFIYLFERQPTGKHKEEGQKEREKQTPAPSMEPQHRAKSQDSEFMI